MSTATDAGVVPPNVQGNLGQRALSLGVANAFDYAIQFLLPVVLVRCLDAEAFGQYRLLWLVVGTVMAFLPLAMEGSLYYYLPRSDATTKRLYINQTLVFFAAAGLIAAWAVSAWNPWLPAKLHGFSDSEIIVPAFMALWVVSSVLDLLPTIEERVLWQAKATVGLALLRAVAMSLVAWLTGELTPVLLTLLAFVLFKAALLLRYVAVHHGLRGPVMRRKTFADQMAFAAPFWGGGVLYGLRAQADQWVAATLFSLSMFASFSIAAVIGPLVNLCRQSVNNAFLPSMSRLQAEGSISAMLELNSRANVMVGALIFPLLAFMFVFAEEIVTIVYTDAYIAAAPVMRLYIIGFAALVIELASITLLLRQGPFMLWLNLTALGVSVAMYWYGAQYFGLPGAALGTVFAICGDRAVTLWRISRLTGVAMRTLQDWRTLGLLALMSALAAALAWGIVGSYLAASGLFARVFAGGMLLAAAYVALRACFGMDRELLRALRNYRHGVGVKS